MEIANQEGVCITKRNASGYGRCPYSHTIDLGESKRGLLLVVVVPVQDEMFCVPSDIAKCVGSLLLDSKSMQFVIRKRTQYIWMRWQHQSLEWAWRVRAVILDDLPPLRHCFGASDSLRENRGKEFVVRGVG
jgi:hypothetical protein